MNFDSRDTFKTGRMLQYVNQHAISASISIYHVTLERRVD